MTVHDYDVVIVGAGPGGSIAAKESAEKGLKTIFFERGRKPGEKNSSGCGLGPRMWLDFDIMKELTPEDCPSMRAGAAARNYFVNSDNVVAGYVMTRPTESVSYEPAKSFITMNVYRSEFDPWLADFATRAGAQLKTSTLITGLIKEDGKVVGVIDEKGEKYKGLVIGADGAVSTVAKESGLRTRWAQENVTITTQYDFEVQPSKIGDIMGDETLAVWWSATFPAAYQVFFNDGFHIGSVNWMTWWDKNPRYYLDQVINLKYFKRLMRILDAKPREFQAHLLPWQGYPEDTHTDNVILIGDAGGFPCPLEAEGIYPAMITARAAVETAVEAISEGDTSKEFLSRFDTKWKATSVGEEFETGPELASIWKALPFSPRKTMSWFVPLIMEILGGIIDWSQPHAKRVRQVARRIKHYLPIAAPFILKEALPLLSAILGDKMDLLTDPAKLIESMPELETAIAQAFAYDDEEEGSK
ncbi:MAG: NAD(P)/FAD-dependent oxidoreductase [Candidatus Thorarchaeota archaeon]|jgi:flavin-dependent dehydrogenase